MHVQHAPYTVHIVRLSIDQFAVMTDKSMDSYLHPTLHGHFKNVCQ